MSNTKNNKELNFITESKLLVDGYIKRLGEDWLAYIQDDQNVIKVFSITKGVQINEIKMPSKAIFRENHLYVPTSNTTADIYSYEMQKTDTLVKEVGRSEISFDERNLLTVTEKYLYIYDLRKKEMFKKINNDKHIINVLSYSQNNLIGLNAQMDIVSININDTTVKSLFPLIDSTQMTNLNIVNSQIIINYDKGENISFDINQMSLNGKSKIEMNTHKQPLQYQSELTNNFTTVIIKNTKTKISEVCFFDQKVYKHQIILDKFLYVQLDSSIGNSFIFDMNGKVIARLGGFSSKQNIVSANESYLTTAGTDNIIHIYNLNEIKNLKMSEDLDQEMVLFFEKAYGKGVADLFISSNTQSLQGFADYAYKKLVEYPISVEQLKSMFQTFFIKKYNFLPIVSFYMIPNSNDWIIFNPEGYFASSPNGENLIQYHVNQGYDKEAKIVDNKKLYSTFYRPDLIRKSLLETTKITQPDVSLEKILSNINPPSLEIISYDIKNEKNLNLKFKVCDEGSGVSDVQLFVNTVAVAVDLNRGLSKTDAPLESKDKCQYFANQVTLLPGKNTLYVKAFDVKNSLFDTSKTVEVTTNYEIKKPNLHIFTVAIDKYRDASLHLKYPVKDASALNQELVLKTKKLFNNVITYNMYDEHVNQNELFEKFKSISSTIDVNDVFVLFIAGHGITHNKNGKYYYLPSDFRFVDESSIEKNGLSIDYFKEALSLIPANKSLILLDTCSSGSFVDSFTTRGLEEKMAINRLTKATGRNFIVASTKEQVALEGYKDHGVFTYSLLEALQNKASYGADNILTIGELALFVENRVPEISYKTFGYEQVPQKQLNGNDFPIAVGE